MIRFKQPFKFKEWFLVKHNRVKIVNFYTFVLKAKLNGL